MIILLRDFVLGSDFVLLDSDGRRLRLKRVAMTALLVITLVIVFILGYAYGLGSGGAMGIAKDHARTFGGLIASVIPIFAVALYVESSPRWGSNGFENLNSDGQSEVSSSRHEEKEFVSPLQLLFCLFGEIFAMSSALSPTTNQLRLATYSLAFLLLLFGYRLNIGVVNLIRPETSQVSRYIGVSTFLLFMLIFSIYLAGISRIIVT